MCRLFGMLSVNASNAWKYLITDPCSLFIQSKADTRRLQSDGWGIGFYTAGVPTVIKSYKPIYFEYKNFVSAVKKAHSRVVIAHIRQASNPRALPREKLIAIENTQPFNYNKYIFAHNGTIFIPDEVTKHLGKWKLRLKSLNDSEVFFWYIIKELKKGVSFIKAATKFVELLSILWKKNKNRYNHDRPYIGLNVLLSNGKKIYAYCKYSEKEATKLSLCLKDQPLFQMSFFANSKHLIVTSEKTNSEDKWQCLKSGQFLTGQLYKNKIKISFREL